MTSDRNKTMKIDSKEKIILLSKTITLNSKSTVKDIENKIIYQDLLKCIDFLPDSFIDLLIIDPPYNLTKVFGTTTFSKTDSKTYETWLDSWMSKIVRCLKPTSSIYICCDWQASKSIQTIAEKYFIIRNRITWEREKGRGAKTNWKNCSEDIWFATMSKDYYFNVEAIKLKKKVIAPYKNKEGEAKDWEETSDGNFRLTFPSNLMTDISIPFWSMPENTEHPTQKPEKLMAKLILASSKESEVVFDPFMGSGTTAVVAKKLGRIFSGVEQEELYVQLTEKRLLAVENDKVIQGYQNGVFWERNTLAEQGKETANIKKEKETQEKKIKSRNCIKAFAI